MGTQRGQDVWCEGKLKAPAYMYIDCRKVFLKYQEL